MKRLRIIFISSLILIVFLITTFNLFKIKVIHCQISEQNCNQDLYQKLDVLKGQSLFLVNFDHQLNQPEFQNIPNTLVSYQKKFPGTIMLQFNEEKVLYKISFGENHFFVSEFGNILQTNQNNSNLPEIIFSDDSKVMVENSAINQNIHLEISQILMSLSKGELKINKINWLSDTEIIIEIENNPNIIFDKDSIETKLDQLNILLNSKEIKDYPEPIKEIDFRFNLPVLRTEIN